MTWYYKGAPLREQNDENYVGFVYIITELDTDRKYIGKKLFWKKVPRKINGKKRKITVPSDWDMYYGSSASLQANISVKGKDNYHREILYLCTSRGEMSYYETKEQFERNVLLNEEYFNEFIGCRINSTSVKHLA